MGTTGVTIFREEQRFRQWWHKAGYLAGTAIILADLLHQLSRGKPFGNDQGRDWTGIEFNVFILFVGLLAFLKVGTATEVAHSGITVRWWPYTTHRIALEQIVAFQASTYRPVRDYGGWGIKGWGNKRIDNVSGDQGVELELASGKRAMIGTQRPTDLAAAIRIMLENVRRS